MKSTQITVENPFHSLTQHPIINLVIRAETQNSQVSKTQRVMKREQEKQEDH